MTITNEKINEIEAAGTSGTPCWIGTKICEPQEVVAIIAHLRDTARAAEMLKDAYLLHERLNSTEWGWVCKILATGAK